MRRAPLRRSPRSRLLLAALLVDLLSASRSRRSCSPARSRSTRGQDLRLHRAGGELRPAARLHRHRLVRPHDVLRHRRLRRRRSRSTAGARPGLRSRSARCRRSSLAVVLALVIGLFSLRVRAIFFAMITLAVASVFAILASQLSGSPAARTAATISSRRCCGRASGCSSRAVFGVADQRPASSPTTCSSSPALVLFLVLLRVVNSPFGRVLQAIRENDFRAEAIGYRTVRLPPIVNCISAAHGDAGRRAAGASGCANRPGRRRSPSTSCSTSC